MRQTLPQVTTDRWENTRREAFGQAELGAAYDGLTKLEAENRQAQPHPGRCPGPRCSTARRRRPASSSSSSTWTTSRALAMINKTDPETSKQYDQNLRKIIAAAGSNSTRLETVLQTLAGHVPGHQEIRGEHVGNRGAWTVDLPEQNMGPTAPRFERTEEWTSYIQQQNVLDRVRPGKQIGRGGYGTINVLEVNNPNDVWVPPLVMKVFTDPDNARKEAQKELEMYQKVGEHPNIPRCLGIRQVGGQTGLVMEHVQGRNMDDYSKELRRRYAKGEVTFEEFHSTIQYTLTKTLETLAFLHEKGLVHNDVKGGNVMVDEVTGEVKVIDLGNVEGTHLQRHGQSDVQGPGGRQRGKVGHAPD